MQPAASLSSAQFPTRTRRVRLFFPVVLILGQAWQRRVYKGGPGKRVEGGERERAAEIRRCAHPSLLELPPSGLFVHVSQAFGPMS